MGGDGIARLGQGAQALRAPDPLLVALIEQPRQHPTGARDVAYQAEPGEELEPIQGEGNVADVALGVRAQRVPQQLEDRLEQLLAGQDEKRPTGCRGGKVVPQPLDESGALPLHRREEGEHLDREDRGRVSGGLEHRLALRLLEGLCGELAPQVLGDVAGDRVRSPAHARVVDVAGARQGARRRFPAQPPGPAPQTRVGLGCLVILDQQLLRPLGDHPVRVVRFDA